MLGGMRALRQQLVDSLRSFRGIYDNQSLRRLQYAWIGSSIGTWAYTIALLVYAYRHGGASAVGFVGLIRWLPAAVAAPFGGMLGDRLPRLLVMKASDFVRTLIRVAPAEEERREPSPGGWRGEIGAGFSTVARDPRLRLIVGLFAAQTLVYGAFVVLVAVAAIELLHLGSSGVGYLNSALGIGGLIGGIAAVALVGSRRLAVTFGLALVLWGAPILIVGLWAKTIPAFLLI